MKVTIQPTPYSLNIIKKVQIYGLISTDGIGLKSIGLVTPKNSLKLNVLEKRYKEKIVLRLEDIRREEKIDVKDNKIRNISILLSTTATTKKNWQKKRNAC